MLTEFLSSDLLREIVVVVAFVNILTGAIMDAIPAPANPGKRPGKKATDTHLATWEAAVRAYKVAKGRRKLTGKGVGLAVAGIGATAMQYLPEAAGDVFTTAVLAKWLGMSGHITAGNVLRLMGLQAKEPDPEAEVEVSGLDLPPA